VILAILALAFVVYFTRWRDPPVPSGPGAAVAAAATATLPGPRSHRPRAQRQHRRDTRFDGER